MMLAKADLRKDNQGKPPSLLGLCLTSSAALPIICSRPNRCEGRWVSTADIEILLEPPHCTEAPPEPNET
jgi:hypothetical protein